MITQAPIQAVMTAADDSVNVEVKGTRLVVTGGWASRVPKSLFDSVKPARWISPQSPLARVKKTRKVKLPGPGADHCLQAARYDGGEPLKDEDGRIDRDAHFQQHQFDKHLDRPDDGVFALFGIEGSIDKNTRLGFQTGYLTGRKITARRKEQDNWWVFDNKLLKTFLEGVKQDAIRSPIRQQMKAALVLVYFYRLSMEDKEIFDHLREDLDAREIRANKPVGIDPDVDSVRQYRLDQTLLNSSKGQLFGSLEALTEFRLRMFNAGCQRFGKRPANYIYHRETFWSEFRRDQDRKSRALTKENEEIRKELAQDK